jgi:hypothetical protein
MLGMNDGRYRAFDQRIFGAYARGYAEMVEKIKAALPGVRIVAIRPSPYDEVTREPMQGGGYNAVLVKFGDYLAELAAKQGLHLADLNGPVVAVLAKANSTDPALAQRIIPDRVHPGPGGHLIMAAALLKAWHAPARVTEVTVNTRSGETLSQGVRRLTKVADARSSDVVAWNQEDESLPMPIDPEDAPTVLAVRSSGFLDSLNRQMLKVTGLGDGYWALDIDGSRVTALDARRWAEGVNLAMLPTPMVQQAAEVHTLTLKRTGIHQTRWRNVQVPLEKDSFAGTRAAVEALDALDRAIAAEQRKKAQVVAHRFELKRVTEQDTKVPAGFVPILNGKDLTGWHISQVNHHGKTQAWTVENGVLKGTQDKPGHGGILLTDKSYRNFEVYLEVNPDFGCDSGLFLRSNEKGQAYQVMLDYLEGGSVGGVYGEALNDVRGAQAETWQQHWRKGEWNSIRARIEGMAPRIQVWMNGAKIMDWTDTANHLADGAETGMVAVQVHLGKRWVEGGFHRFRNIAIKELP